MKVFEPAAERSTAANLARTLAQTLVFWVVFIGVMPWVILRLERELGVPAFTFAARISSRSRSGWSARPSTCGRV